ncbi:MAG: Lrp/AsnC family transcriptional regulator [Candidatus Bathyarchaeota archaeon]|nr:Lrp/AsnC family transcriptional regulator [Candidatus Bathyarchaeota archaeon]MDH5664382.1 Lrp/AsnC family transcriptional regulator [Candidatus Bathyarchaeota archaeon]
MVTLAYILITLKSGSEREVCKKVSSFEEVVQVDELYGEYDGIVKVRVEDLSQLDKFLTDKLRVLPDIFLTTTMIVAKEHRHK